MISTFPLLYCIFLFPFAFLLIFHHNQTIQNDFFPVVLFEIQTVLFEIVSVYVDMISYLLIFLSYTCSYVFMSVFIFKCFTYMHFFVCLYISIYIFCVCVCAYCIFLCIYLHCVCVWVHAVSVCVLMLAVVFVHAYSLVLFAKLWTRQNLGYTSEITICACNRC